LPRGPDCFTPSDVKGSYRSRHPTAAERLFRGAVYDGQALKARDALYWWAGSDFAAGDARRSRSSRSHLPSTMRICRCAGATPALSFESHFSWSALFDGLKPSDPRLDAARVGYPAHKTDSCERSHDQVNRWHDPESRNRVPCQPEPLLANGRICSPFFELVGTAARCSAGWS
jgi:hypothetical protein